MAKTAILSVRIISDAKKAVQGFQETSRAAQLMDSALNAAKAGLVAAGAAATAFTVSAVSQASELEQSQGAVQAVFGDQSAAMEKLASDAALNLGLTKNEFNELATIIGSQLKNGGTAMEEMAPKTQELIGIGADLAAMFGGTTAEAVGALSSALRGERDPIERYGVSLNQAAVDAKAAELGFEKVGGALSTEANQAATLALIMEQTTAAHGAFAREGDTLATQQQILAAQWGNLSAEVGTYLLPAMTGLVSWANGALMPWLAEMSTQIPVVVQNIVNFAQTVAGNLTAAFRENEPVITQVATIIGTLLIPAFIRMAGTATVAAGAQVASWALSAAGAIATGIAYVATAPKVILGWVQMGAAAVASGAQTAAIWLMYQVDAAKAALAHIASAGRIVAGWVMTGAAAIASGAQTAAIWLMYKVEAAQAALAHMAQAGRVVAGWVLMGTQSLIQGARMAAAWFIGLGPVGWAIAAIIAVVAVVVANWDKIVAFTQEAWTAVSQWVSDKVNAVVTWVTDAWNNVVNWTTSAYENVKSAVLTAMVKVVTAVVEKGAEVIGWFRDLPGVIGEKLSNMASSLAQMGRDMILGLIGGIKEKAKAVVDSVKGVVDGAIDGAKKLLGIKSPSRLFRNEIGAQMGAGLVLGIESSAGAVQKATEDMLHIPEVAANAMGSREIELSARLAPAPSPTAQQGQGYGVVNVTVNGFMGDRMSLVDEIEKLFTEKRILRGGV